MTSKRFIFRQAIPAVSSQTETIGADMDDTRFPFPSKILKTTLQTTTPVIITCPFCIKPTIRQVLSFAAYSVPELLIKLTPTFSKARASHIAS